MYTAWLHEQQMMPQNKASRFLSQVKVTLN